MVHKKKIKKTAHATRYILACVLAASVLLAVVYRYPNTHRFSLLKKTASIPLVTLHATPTTPTTDARHYWIRTACTDTPQQANHLCQAWKTTSIACRVDTQNPPNKPCARVVLGPYRTMDQARLGEKWLALRHLRGHLE